MAASVITSYSIHYTKLYDGKGIIRISRLEGGAYQSMTALVGGTKRQVYPSLTKLYSAISPKMKTTRYQIQQGLVLIESDRRPVDFRALVQKNRSGAWNITSIVARTAGSQHFVSNLARGGSVITSYSIHYTKLYDAYPFIQRQLLDL